MKVSPAGMQRNDFRVLESEEGEGQLKKRRLNHKWSSYNECYLMSP